MNALLAQAAGRLGARTGLPHLDAELLLAHVLGKDRTWLKTHPEQAPAEAERERYAGLIERRAAGEPLAYLVGYRDFWTLRVAVSPAVLVPRPETELLVERALELAVDPAARVADLGTGSGAIALALASERPGWSVLGTDVSAQALAVARSNAAALALTRIEWVQGSWFAPLADRRFDLILSNPPYIAEGETELAHATLQYEPRLALSPGKDGLECLRTIVEQAPQHLERGGWLLLEHGATQSDEVARHLVARGFAHVRSHSDLAGLSRITEGRWLSPSTTEEP